MIRELTAEDIAQILRMDDPIGEVFPCDRGEWVQWLNQYVDNPDVHIIGISDENMLISYAVAVSMIAPPLSNAISIIFMSEPLDMRYHEEIKDWARQRGADAVMLQAKEAGILHTLGTDAISYVGIWRT